MKAALFTEVGQPISVREDFAETNMVGEEVAVIASALNHRDLWITKGMYPGLQPNVILGSDAVGRHEGSRVVINPGLHWGSSQSVQSDDFEVLGMPSHGTFADEVYVDARYIHAAPEHLSDHEAAALPLAGVTAYRTLISRCRASAGEKVLVTGVGGGVALLAVQMAVALGCEVYVTSGSEEKIERAMTMGATAGANYKEENWAKQILAASDGGVDVIIDSAGGAGFGQLTKICRPGARIGFYGAGQGKWPPLNPQLLFWRQISILGSTMGSPQDFAEMLLFVSEHQIRPVIDRIFTFGDIAQAFDYMETGQQFGKIVINHR